MGKNFRKTWKHVVGFFQYDKKSLRRLTVATVSLTLAIVTSLTVSFSWFSLSASKVEAMQFVLDCGKGLRVNDSGTSELSFSQVEKHLIPASSVDGRNLYFPTDGSDFSSTTEFMTFRSANAGDKNENYIQIDFTLTAQQDYTALYINDKKTSIKMKDHEHETEYSISQAAPLRAALWSSTAENGVPNTPIVFNATNSVMHTAAVADVDRSNGAFIASGRQVAYTFSDYSFGGKPVATLSKGVETKFSYIIWLEGTDPKCTDRVISKDIEIKLAFTTSWDKTQTIRFEDQTEGSWVKEKINPTDANAPKYSLSLHYDEVNENNVKTGNKSEFNMYEVTDNDHQWSCNIPGDMKKEIYFILRPPAGSENLPTYAFTYSSKTPGVQTLDRGPNRLYVAELGPYESGNNDTCRGYWVAVGDSDGAGHDSGNLDGDDF